VAAYCVDNRLVKLARDREGRSFLERSITPVDRRAVIFSSELNHHVEANRTDRPRISIAWNIIVDSPCEPRTPQVRPIAEDSP
jgi:ectoine hydroxylase-related dioxygenase (phytanoyl-CoA dioxygenase family)